MADINKNNKATKDGHGHDSFFVPSTTKPGNQGPEAPSETLQILKELRRIKEMEMIKDFLPAFKTMAEAKAIKPERYVLDQGNFRTAITSPRSHDVAGDLHHRMVMSQARAAKDATRPHLVLAAYGMTLATFAFV
ncbi:hypothetical protein NKR19_g8371 [Coniochaeta hoffmannii]|uniref:Uncharacterized protein n=1 Tax=Coniochaeta hoffmannii TaxID=91930 RepID=A0AA38R6S2_9PEZI|nr:hypothetical protein NKR19_g8371 [Coniochaeta hoffmannii]